MIRELMDDCSTVVSNQGGEYVMNPTVAKSIDGVMNEDGTKTYTVVINDGLVFNNGDPITAKNFVAFNLLCCSPMASTLGIKSTAYLQIVGGQEYYKGEASYVSGIRLIDEMTYSFTISSDYVPYFYDLTNAGGTAAHLASWFGADVDIVDDGEGCYFTGVEYTVEEAEAKDAEGNVQKDEAGNPVMTKVVVPTDSYTAFCDAGFRGALQLRQPCFRRPEQPGEL
jgi:peptide/nickel transport system substrate-binding protein